jgi:hypothetical protein
VSAAFNPDNCRSTRSRSFFNCFTNPAKLTIESPSCRIVTDRARFLSDWCRRHEMLATPTSLHHTNVAVCRRLATAMARSGAASKLIFSSRFQQRPNPADEDKDEVCEEGQWRGGW